MSHAEALNARRLPGTDPLAATIVFSHGYGCDQTMWDGMIGGLPEHDRVLFDWAGVGRSPMSAYDVKRHRTLDGYADDLLGLLAELQLREVVFIGHSVAASIAALAALREPGRFARLFMVAPSPRFANDPPDYVGGFEHEELDQLVQGLAENHSTWARGIAPLVMGPQATPEATTQLENAFCAMDPTVALTWARATFLSDVRDAMRRVPTKSLVLQCADDALAPVAVGRWLADNMPDAQLEVIEVTGHCPHVVAPLAVLSILRRFLPPPG
jgi:sigma-B regulation protein RsbQ